MKRMTVEELYNYLCSPQFLDEKSGNIFYNYYIYQYADEKEYEMRAQLKDFKENLVRPTSFVDVVMLDLFDTFCEFLDSQSFGLRYPSRLNYVLEKDEMESLADNITSMLSNSAHQSEFFIFVHECAASKEL